MNLNELRNEVKSLAGFAFLEYPVEEVVKMIPQLDVEDFKEGPGLYRILSGSRGIIEEIERVGDDEDSLYVPSPEEVANEDPEFYEEFEDYDEFWFCSEDAEHPGVLLFGYTEEEFDYFVMVLED